MAKTMVGSLPPLYSFILNQYSHERLSKCPKCRRPTHLRKFSLLVHIDAWRPIALGKTCRYCTPCELIIVHQDELEGVLAECFGTIAPGLIGNKYRVLGTVDKGIWLRGLEGRDPQIEEVLKPTADFRRVLAFTVQRGGWNSTNRGSLTG